jgi:HSP20 family protein
MEAAMDVKSIVPWRRDRGDVTKQESLGSFPEVFGLHRQVNRLFDDFFRDFDGPLPRTFATSWPAREVQDGEKEIKIVAELPGLEEKDIDLSLRDGILTIKGEKTRKMDGAVYSERWHGQFSRAIELSPDIDPDKIKASFDKGVLTITVEKQPNPKAETKKITINRG